MAPGAVLYSSHRFETRTKVWPPISDPLLARVPTALGLLRNRFDPKMYTRGLCPPRTQCALGKALAFLRSRGHSPLVHGKGTFSTSPNVRAPLAHAICLCSRVPSPDCVRLSTVVGYGDPTTLTMSGPPLPRQSHACNRRFGSLSKFYALTCGECELYLFQRLLSAAYQLRCTVVRFIRSRSIRLVDRRLRE